MPVLNLNETSTTRLSLGEGSTGDVPQKEILLMKNTRNIVVAGASGNAGQAVTKHLKGNDYPATATDVVTAPVDFDAPFISADLTDYGQAVDVLDGADAVVHLANIPAPGIYAPSTILNANTTMNSDVFLAAAAKLGIDRVVWASSEATLGPVICSGSPRSTRGKTTFIHGISHR